MRWLTTLATVTGLGVVGLMVWNAQGPQILEKLHLTCLLPAETTPSMDVETLVEMCQNDALKNQLDWKVEAKLNRSAFANYTAATPRAFLGGDATDAEAQAAVHDFQRRLEIAQSSPFVSDDSAPVRRMSIRPSQPRTNASAYDPNNSQNDYKRIPRMQRFGLTNLQQFGNLNPFNTRTIFEQSRFAQQQREVDRLRARRDVHVGGRVVSKD